ncbi:MAG TPA: hypothetical protein VMS02_05095 [Solirubrobacteraceae bacterium]|nr:hypothetical protein [Solirubrobacteraceae bacterium]
MTDTFASGSSQPGGPSPETAEPTGDVTQALAELERKLRDLERELTSIGRRRNPPQGEPGQGELGQSGPGESEPVQAGLRHTGLGETGLGQTEPRHTELGGRSEPRTAPRPRLAEPTGRLVDEALERPAPRPAAAPARPRPSEAQLVGLAELRRFRDRLERFARELTAEYDALLGRVMAGFSAAPAQTEPPGQLEPPVVSRHEPPVASRREPSRHEPLRPDPEAPAPAVAPAPEDALFEGRVELGVGPFYDIGSLGAFERRLASVPGVSEASVRRFEASHAVVDVRLATPIALLRELRRTADSDFSVREVAAGRILLTFDDA